MKNILGKRDNAERCGMNLACARTRKTDLWLKWSESGGWRVDRGWQGHLGLCRSREGIWVYSKCNGKLLKRSKAVEWYELIKRRERKE